MLKRTLLVQLERIKTLIPIFLPQLEDFISVLNPREMYRQMIGAAMRRKITIGVQFSGAVFSVL